MSYLEDGVDVEYSELSISQNEMDGFLAEQRIPELKLNLQAENLREPMVAIHSGRLDFLSI